MRPPYADIYALAKGIIELHPRWWDEHGVPRFQPFTPDQCPDVGATEVVLVQVACQNCAREFPVQMSWDRMRVMRAVARARALGMPRPDPEQFQFEVGRTTLAYQVAGGAVHYGDPPFHDRCTGNTMNVWNLRVLEFWRRKEKSIEYMRIPELELVLPDTHDKERIGPS